MSSVEEPPKNLHLSLTDYLRHIDKPRVAFCPDDLSPDEIVNFSSQNRDKILLISCIGFDKPLSELYSKPILPKVIRFVSFLCFDEESIDESMTLFDVFEKVQKHFNLFLSKVLYRIYTEMTHSATKDSVSETLKMMANEFQESWIKHETTGG